MARIARIVIPKIPHHVVQRGNRNQRTFFQTTDYQSYIDLMAEWCLKNHVEIWAYCLMPNHTHLIAVPDHPQGMVAGIGEAHRRYSRMINFRNSWRGHLWQGRFASYPMDEKYFLTAARYIERNPVVSGICTRPEDYQWSSARAHKTGKDNELVKVTPLLDRIEKWQEYIDSPYGPEDVAKLYFHERTGKPVGSNDFINQIEKKVGQCLRSQKPGPKKVKFR